MAGHAIHLLTSSAWAPLLIFGLAAVIARLAGVRKLRLPWVFFSATLCCAILFAAIAYLLTPILFEDAETDIACISTLAMRGFPVYPALDSAARYILLYGPLTYLVHVPLYVVFGKNLFSFKLLGVISFLASMLGLYGICRKYASRRDSMIGLGCAAVVLFRYIGVEFWGRIDPLILALTVLSVWSTSAWLDMAGAFGQRVCPIGDTESETQRGGLSASAHWIDFLSKRLANRTYNHRTRSGLISAAVLIAQRIID